MGCIVDSVKPDVLIATETWLSTSISSSEFFPPGYNVYRKDRQDGYGVSFCLIKVFILPINWLLTPTVKS